MYKPKYISTSFYRLASTHTSARLLYIVPFVGCYFHIIDMNWNSDQETYRKKSDCISAHQNPIISHKYVKAYPTLNLSAFISIIYSYMHATYSNPHSEHARLDRLSLSCTSPYTPMARDIRVCNYIIICFCVTQKVFRQVLKQNQKQKLANDRSGTLSFIFRHTFPFQVHCTDMQSQIFHIPCHIQHEYPKAFVLLKRFLISAVFILASQFCWECHQIPLECLAVALTLSHSLFGQAIHCIIQIASYILFGIFGRWNFLETARNKSSSRSFASCKVISSRQCSMLYYKHERAPCVNIPIWFNGICW